MASGKPGAVHVTHQPTLETFDHYISKLKRTRKSFQRVVDFLGAATNRKGLTELIQSSLFSAIKEQLICFDDIERAGTAISVNELMGLALNLVEQHNCKVVFLLNQERLLDKDLFQINIEKIANATLTFNPTPAEAALVALPNNIKYNEILRPLMVNLKLNNIRLIKKIETLANKVTDILLEFDNNIIRQALETVVLAGWCVHSPEGAPSISFIRTYNKMATAMREPSKAVTQQTIDWEASIASYPFNHADNFDKVIIDGVAKGYFSKEEILEEALKLAKVHNVISRSQAFDRVWKDFYDGPMSLDDDVILGELFKAARNEIDVLSLSSLNSTVKVLRENGRNTDASQLVQLFLEINNEMPDSVANAEQQFLLQRNELDEELGSLLYRDNLKLANSRYPADVLLEAIGKSSWDTQDVKTISYIGSDVLIALLLPLEGKEVRNLIETLNNLGDGTSDDAERIRQVSSRAFESIASMSPLRRRRLRQYGAPV